MRARPDSGSHRGRDEDTSSNIWTTNVGRRNEVFEDGSIGRDERVVPESKPRYVGSPAARDGALVILVHDVRRPPVEKTAASGVSCGLENSPMLEEIRQVHMSVDHVEGAKATRRM